MGSQENFTNFKTGLDQKVANSEDAADAMDEQIAKINADIDGLEYACEQAGQKVEDTAMGISFVQPDYFHTFDKYFSGHIDLDSTSSQDSKTCLSDFQVHTLLSEKAIDSNFYSGFFHVGLPSGYDSTSGDRTCSHYTPYDPGGDPPPPDPTQEGWTHPGDAQFYIDSTSDALYNILNTIKNPVGNQKNWLAIQQGSDETSISIVTIVCIDYLMLSGKYYTILCVSALPPSELNTFGNTTTFNVNTSEKISQIGYSYYRNLRPIQGVYGVSSYIPGDAGQNWGVDTTADATIESQVGDSGIYRYCLNYCWAPISLDGTYGLIAQRNNIEIGKQVNQNNQDNDKEGQTQLGDIT